MLKEKTVADEGAEVKRDMDLIRTIMLKIQEKKDLEHEIINIDGFEELVVGRHMEMLLEAGMIDATESKSLGRIVPMVMVRDLTWEGHEFIGAIGKDSTWNKLKEEIGPNEMASLPIKIIKDGAIAVAAAYVKMKLGI